MNKTVAGVACFSKKVRKMTNPWENKSFFRCNVCNDIHYGVIPPILCPSCGQQNKYIKVNKKEAELVIKGLSEN